MPKISRNPDVLWREEDDAINEALTGQERGEDVSDVGTSLLFADGQMLVLNILGTEIWNRCESKDLGALLEELMSEFEVLEEVLRADVTAFLAELEAKGFIKYVS